MSSPSNQLSVNQRLALNMGLKTQAGLVLSGLASLLLARRAGTRLLLTGLGTGWGAGYAWCQNDYYLKDPASTQLPLSLESEVDKYYQMINQSIPSFLKFKD